MSVDEYMRLSLLNQERTVALLEQIAARATTNVVLQPNHEAVTRAVGSVSETKVTPTKESASGSSASPAQSAKQPAESKASTAQAAAGQAATSASAGESKKEQAAAPSEAAPAVKLTKGDGKPITLDDARKAVKAFSAIEGTDAVMEILGQFGAGSVSAVAEQGEEALASLYWKAGGK